MLYASSCYVHQVMCHAGVGVRMDVNWEGEIVNYLLTNRNQLDACIKLC